MKKKYFFLITRKFLNLHKLSVGKVPLRFVADFPQVLQHKSELREYQRRSIINEIKAYILKHYLNIYSPFPKMFSQ